MGVTSILSFRINIDAAAKCETGYLYSWTILIMFTFEIIINKFENEFLCKCRVQHCCSMQIYATFSNSFEPKPGVYLCTCMYYMYTVALALRSPW